MVSFKGGFSYRRMVACVETGGDGREADIYELWTRRTSEKRIDPNRDSREKYFGRPGLDRKPTGTTMLYMPRGEGDQRPHKLLQEDLIAMCAQDIFTSFFKAVTNIIEEIGGTTKPRANKPTMDIELEKFLITTAWDGVLNSELHKMAEIFVNNELGSREEAYMCMIPAIEHRPSPSFQT